MYVFGYVVMPEHVHLLLGEPSRDTLADAIHYLKLTFAKRLRTLRRSVECGSFWQKRYHDRNIRDADEFTTKLRYLHRNPVKRGLVKEPGDWKWSSFRHYAYRETCVVDIESEWTARDRETKEQRRPSKNLPQPRLASKGRTRTWGTNTLPGPPALTQRRTY